MRSFRCYSSEEGVGGKPKMSADVLMVIIALLVGFAAGWPTAWLAWRRRFAESEAQSRNLRASLKGKDVKLLDLRSRLHERQACIGRLRVQVGQSEERIQDLLEQVEKRDQAIARLQSAVCERHREMESPRNCVHGTKAGGEGSEDSPSGGGREFAALWAQLERESAAVERLEMAVMSHSEEIEGLMELLEGASFRRCIENQES